MDSLNDDVVHVFIDENVKDNVLNSCKFFRHVYDSYQSLALYEWSPSLAID